MHCSLQSMLGTEKYCIVIDIKADRPESDSHTGVSSLLVDDGRRGAEHGCRLLGSELHFELVAAALLALQLLALEALGVHQFELLVLFRDLRQLRQ